MTRPTISTRTGDRGETGLFGGQRTSKSSARLHAYGTVDELNAILGVTLAEELPSAIARDLASIQKTLFVVGADLATPEEAAAKIGRLQESAVQALEIRGAALEKELPALAHFILPGGCRAGALLHQARTVCRRAERWVVALSEIDEVNSHVLVYLNRLGDYLFLASRYVNHVAGCEEREWRGES